MRIESPSAGFVTRTGRKVYGQAEYRRDYKTVMGLTAVTVFVGLWLAVGVA